MILYDTISKTIGQIYHSYLYLYKSNECHHYKTIKKLLLSILQYYRERRNHLKCSLVKIHKNKYLLNYCIGNRHHKLEITISKGPHSNNIPIASSIS